jgi:hypothetical protein
MKKPQQRATDFAWAQIEAERNLQKVKILLEEALAHVEDAETLNRDKLIGYIGSALLVCIGKKAAERDVKKDAFSLRADRHA